jgi:hypothetical protein
MALHTFPSSRTAFLRQHTTPAGRQACQHTCTYTSGSFLFVCHANFLPASQNHRFSATAYPRRRSHVYYNMHALAYVMDILVSVGLSVCHNSLRVQLQKADIGVGATANDRVIQDQKQFKPLKKNRKVLCSAPNRLVTEARFCFLRPPHTYHAQAHTHISSQK